MYEFKGHDWTELGDAWGLRNPEEEDDKSLWTHDPGSGLMAYEALLAGRIKQKLRWLDQDCNPDPQTVADIRAYLTALTRVDPSYNTPIYEGLLKVKHDQVLLSWVHDNLLRMWS